MPFLRGKIKHTTLNAIGKCIVENIIFHTYVYPKIIITHTFHKFQDGLGVYLIKFIYFCLQYV